MKQNQKLMELIGQVSPELIEKTLPADESGHSKPMPGTVTGQPVSRKSIFLRYAVAAAVAGLFLSAGITLMHHMNSIRTPVTVPGAAAPSDAEFVPETTVSQTNLPETVTQTGETVTETTASRTESTAYTDSDGTAAFVTGTTADNKQTVTGTSISGAQQPSVTTGTNDETPSAEGAEAFCKNFLNDAIRKVYFQSVDTPVVSHQYTYWDWAPYFSYKMDWEYHHADHTVKSCKLSSLTASTEDFGNEVFVKMNTEYEFSGSSGTTVRSDTHWFRVEMRGTSYRITDWYMPDSEFDREVRGVLTEQDFKDAENAPLKNRYLVKQAELLLPYVRQNTPPAEVVSVNPHGTGCIVKVCNTTGQTAYCGVAFHIEKDGKDLPPGRENLSFIEIAYEIQPDEQKTLTLDWKDIYGALESGTYTLYLDSNLFRDYPIELVIP